MKNIDLYFIGKMEEFKIQQRVLCSWLWDHKNKRKKYIEIILNEINKNYVSYNQNQLAQIRNKIAKNFLPAFVHKWNAVSHKRTI